MRGMTRVAVFAIAGVMLLPRHASAQERREGFWFGFSLGPGSAGVTCTECIFTERTSSGSMLMKGGWTINPHVLVGAEFDFWSENARRPSDPNALTMSLTLSNVSATLTYYPSASSGFFVKGGAGGSMADFDGRLAGNATMINLGSGPGIIAGAGYDLPLWRRVSFTAGVDYWYGRLGDVTFLGDPFARHWTQNIVVVTFGITVP